MVFTTMNSRHGKGLIRNGQVPPQRLPIVKGPLSPLCPLTAFVVSFRVRLSKRRAKAGTQSTTNAVLVCKHRDMNEKELEAQVSAVVPFSLLCVRLNIVLLLVCCWKKDTSGENEISVD